MLGLMLQTGTYNFGQLLQQLEAVGFFSTALPILLIFAFTYSIISMVPMFGKDKKFAAIIISFAIALLSMQFGVVPTFFQNVFPKLGIALSVVLIGLILFGSFAPKKLYRWVFFTLGAICFLTVIYLSFSDWTFIGSAWWSQYGGLSIAVVFVIAAIVAIVAGGGKGGGKEEAEED